jgi:hypothetical protein
MAYSLQRLLRSIAGRLAKFLHGHSNMRTESIESAFSRWSQIKRAESAIAEKVTAAPLSIEAADRCPYCKGNMRLSTAVGVAVYVCDADRHVVPAPNDITLDD